MVARAEIEYSKTPGGHDMIIINEANIEEAFQRLDRYIFSRFDDTI